MQIFTTQNLGAANNFKNFSPLAVIKFRYANHLLIQLLALAAAFVAAIRE